MRKSARLASQDPVDYNGTRSSRAASRSTSASKINLDQPQLPGALPEEEEDDDEELLESIEEAPKQEESDYEHFANSSANPSQQLHKSNREQEQEEGMAAQEGDAVTSIEQRLQELSAQVHSLQAENAQLRAAQGIQQQGSRHGTVDSARDRRDGTADTNLSTQSLAVSAFNGDGTFTRTGAAAHKIFDPFPEGGNPDYSDEARVRGTAPPKYDGNSIQFETWIVQFRSKMREDKSTYREEESRIDALAGLLEGQAYETISARYRSASKPFTCLAEMVQVLETAFQDRNLKSKAKRELANLKYDIRTNFHTFLGRFNNLCEDACVRPEDLKETLWDHIPASIGGHLREMTRNETVNYERFCAAVDDAVYTKKLAMEEGNAYRNARRDRDRAVQSKPPPQQNQGQEQGRRPQFPTNGNRPRAPEHPNISGITCYTCGKLGHKANQCPNKSPAQLALVHEAEIEEGFESAPEEPEEPGNAQAE